MSALLTSMLPALITPLADGIRGAISRFTGGAGAKPQNVGEAIKMIEAQTARMRAIAELDKPSDAISVWVANLRASSRYFAAFAVILNGIGQAAWGADPGTVALSITMAESGFFFLFGDRVYMKLKRAE